MDNEVTKMNKQEAAVSQEKDITILYCCPFCGVYVDYFIAPHSPGIESELHGDEVCAICEDAMRGLIAGMIDQSTVEDSPIGSLAEWFTNEINQGNKEAKAFWSKYLTLNDTDQTDN